MPQKKAKKANVNNAKTAKPKKAAKPLPKKAPVSLLKKAVKVVAKKISGAASVPVSGKKKVEAPAKKALPVSAKKPAKEVAKEIVKEAPAAKKVPAKEAKKAAAPVKEEPKKAAKAAKPVAAPAPAPAAKTNGKKKGEIVLEMPAPKGVALLGREGKKKAKAEAALNARKNRCREPGCEHEHLLSGFCRLHYIKNWRKIKRKEAILASGQLNNYVEELVSKYPDKYLDVIRQDLASEKEWAKVVIDLELESTDEEGAGDEDLEGVAENTGRREREFDDDSDTF